MCSSIKYRATRERERERGKERRRRIEQEKKQKHERQREKEREVEMNGKVGLGRERVTAAGHRRAKPGGGELHLRVTVR